MKVGDLVRAKVDGDGFISWVSDDPAVVIGIYDDDVAIMFPNGEEIRMFKKALEVLFEIISVAP